jgi:hypothetical protein
MPGELPSDFLTEGDVRANNQSTFKVGRIFLMMCRLSGNFPTWSGAAIICFGSKAAIGLTGDE